MLNGDIKKEALRNLDRAKEKHEEEAVLVTKNSSDLFSLRHECSTKVIRCVEEYFSTIAQKPKEFDKEFEEYKARFASFERMVYELHKKSDDVDFKAGASAATGVSAGIGVAAFAPTAAMAIATTFGTASTGTAISALSGAVATKAALAWLGGGALAVGGGGIAKGSALLALAGPVGWAIGGTALVGSAMFARSRNRKVAEEANEARKEVEIQVAVLKSANKEIGALFKQTEEHKQGVHNMLAKLGSFAETNFNKMTDRQKELLMSLKNNVESLSKLIQKKVEA